jgi:hypothetical protein
MTKMMKEAMDALRELPEERQETIARAILDYAPHDDGVYHLSGAERREVRAGLAGRLARVGQRLTKPLVF